MLARLLVALVLGGVLFACARDMPSGPQSAQVEPSLVQQATCSAATPAVSPTYYGSGFTRRWQCYTSLKIVAESADAEAVQQAVQVWKNAFPFHANVNQVPSLSTSGGTVVWRVYDYTTVNESKCGQTDIFNNTIVVRDSTEFTCGANASTSLKDVLVHELAHVLGFNSQWHKNSPLPGGCVHQLPEEGLNTSPCQHEIELIYAAYGYGTISSSSLLTFGTQRIITGLATSPTSVNIDASAQDTISVTAKVFGRQGVANEPGAPSLTWMPSSPANLTITELGSDAVVRVSGDPGTHTAFARATGGAGSGNRIGTWMSVVGHAVPVTITGSEPPPPPPAPLRVTDISIGGSTPVTSSGYKSLTASVSGSYGYPVTIRWRVSYSNGVRPPLDFHDDQWTSVYVAAGSYTLSVTATPGTGYGIQENFPVCTGSDGGGGGNLQRVPDGGATPTAVEGC